jgi:6,7-dimethyl-8-ribityllumazine synthase
MKYKLAIVKALYYNEIANELSNGVNREIQKYKNKFSFQIKNFFVSGVFEIPIIISKNINKFDAFIVLGCVIKGETPHFNFISKSTIEAIMKLSVEYKKPIGNGIITCLNKKQAVERSNVNKKNKGGEATRAILSVLGNPYVNKKKYEQLFSRNKRKS